jgi:ribosomal protein S6E (S10)
VRGYRADECGKRKRMARRGKIHAPKRVQASHGDVDNSTLEGKKAEKGQRGI